ncbi:hypothetical protein ACFLX1_02095 [Chloroflexota bacterium]
MKFRPISIRRLLSVSLITILVTSLVGISGLVMAASPASTTTTTDQVLIVSVSTDAASDPVWLGTTVTASAAANLGEGDTANIMYVVDVSGSMENAGFNPFIPAVGDCDGDGLVGTTLDSACVGLIALNDSFSSAENANVGLVAFADGAVTADVDPDTGDTPFTTPPDVDKNTNNIDDMEEVIRSLETEYGDATAVGGVGQFTDKTSAGFPGGTDYNAALTNMNTAFGAQGAGDINTAFFLSDGTPSSFTTGGGSPLQGAVDAGTVIHTFAMGTTAPGSCDVGQPLRTIADQTGGSCTEVLNPSTLNAVLPATVTRIASLELKVNGATVASISGSEPVSMSLPGVDITSALIVGSNLIEATTTAEDGTVVTADITLGVIDLALTPVTETNELGIDDEHAVLATITGDPSQVAGILIDFSVGGQNAGETGICSINLDCTTDASGQVTFTYTVPKKPDSLGTDTITASTTTASGDVETREVAKDWVDTMPPLAGCLENVNPHGQKTPPAGSTTLPGSKGGQNEDGFYLLDAEDLVWPDAALVIYVTDMGSGTVFGPYTVGTVIKYTESAEAIPEAKKIGSEKGKAGAVAVHIIGNGDAMIVATDGSGNDSDPSVCLVPQPPK